jgi:hypothetical protein
MTQPDWTEQIATIESTLDALEDSVAHEDFPRRTLEELKSALDDLRIRAWGMLMAGTAADPRGFQVHFRILRGRDTCRGLVADLRAGRLNGRHPELGELGAAGSELATAVDEARQQAF